MRSKTLTQYLHQLNQINQINQSFIMTCVVRYAVLFGYVEGIL